MQVSEPRKDNQNAERQSSRKQTGPHSALPRSRQMPERMEMRHAAERGSRSEGEDRPAIKLMKTERREGGKAGE